MSWRSKPRNYASVRGLTGPSGETVPEGVGAGTPAGLDLELGQDAGDVSADGAGTDEKRLRDLAVRVAVDQQAQHLALARRQTREPGEIDRTARRGCGQRSRHLLGLGDGVRQRQRPPRRPGGGKAI